MSTMSVVIIKIGGNKESINLSICQVRWQRSHVISVSYNNDIYK